jgi:hypothetical protein
MKAIIFSEDNGFLVDLLKEKLIRKKFDIKCIIASNKNIEILQNNYKKYRVYKIEDFHKLNIKAIKAIRFNEIDEKIYNKFKHIEPDVIKILDFANSNHNKFSLRHSREAFFSSLVFTLNFLEFFKAKLIFFTNVPHSFNTVLLYHVCQKLGIKTVFKRESSLPGMFLFQNTIEKLNFFHRDYKVTILSKKNKNIFNNYINAIIHKEKNVIKYFLKLRNHELIKNSFLYLRIPFLFYIKKTLEIVPISILRYFRNLFRFYVLNKKNSLHVEDFLKEKNKLFSQSSTSRIKMDFELLLGDFRKINLLNFYQKRAKKLDLQKKYIYFALHYQPEATTYPFGGAFIDQVNAVKLLSSYISDDCFIYIKEHPDTFNTSHLSWTKGDYSRDINFYEQLLTIKNVRFADIEISSQDLINSSYAVATISGAVGLESLIKEKHTFIFGSPWYKNFKDVFKFTEHKNIHNNLKHYMKKKISKKNILKSIERYCNIMFQRNDIKYSSGRKNVVNLLLKHL